MADDAVAVIDSETRIVTQTIPGIANNDNWRDSQEAEITATGLAPPDDLEPAISILLAPGAYTAIASGVDDTTDVALFEAYNLP